MDSPQSYSISTVLEYKRFMTAMDEASDAIVSFSVNPEDAEETEHSHVEHLDRTRIIHTIVRMLAGMAWEDYLVKNLGTMLKTHTVDENNNLIERKAEERSQFTTFTASLRDLCNTIPRSFLFKAFLPSFALEPLQERIKAGLEEFKLFMKYADSVVEFYEKYLTWIEHGSNLAAAFTNTQDHTCTCDNEEEHEKALPEDFYTDVRVRAYALLKVSDLEPTRIVNHINDIGDLMDVGITLVSLAQQLYVSMPPAAFEAVFHAITSSTHRTGTYTGSNFENIHELNEYLREHVRDSIEEKDGFLYNTTELLENTRDYYINAVAQDILDTLSFLPTEESQKRFITQFESGKMWQE